jgi:hypothetical protein
LGAKTAVGKKLRRVDDLRDRLAQRREHAL